MSDELQWTSIDTTPQVAQKPTETSLPATQSSADLPWQTPPIPASSDVSSFMPDPKTAKDSAAISVISQQTLDQLPPYYRSMITDTLQKAAGPSAVQQWKGGLEWTAKQREIDALSFKQALGDKSPELEKQVKDLQVAQQSDPEANFIQSLVSGMGEQGAAGLRAGGMWLLGALSWPYRKLAEVTGLSAVKDNQDKILSTIGENFGLTPERQAAITGNPLAGLGETAKEATAGITGPTYRSLVDQGVNPEVASAASFTIGGALTLLQAIPAGRLIPGAQRLGEESFKAAVVSLAQNGSLTALAKLWGTRVATIGAEQAAFGMINGTTQVLGEEWARQYSNRTKGTAIPATPFPELVKDILITGGTQALVGTVIGGGTAALELRPTYEMGAKLRDFANRMRDARARWAVENPPPQQKLLPRPGEIGNEARAAVDEAHAVMSETPTPEAAQQVKTRLDTSVDAILKDPTPETIPQAIEAARVSDAIETAKAQPVPPTETQPSIPALVALPDNPPPGYIRIYRGINPERNKIASEDATHGYWYTTTYEDAVSYANWDYEGTGELGPNRAIAAVDVPLEDAYGFARSGSRSKIGSPNELLNQDRPVEMLVDTSTAQRATIIEGDVGEGQKGVVSSTQSATQVEQSVKTGVDPLEKSKAGVMTREGKFVTGYDHGDAYNRALDAGFHIDDELGQVAGWKIGEKIFLDKDYPNGLPPETISIQLEQSVKAGIPVEDASLQLHITQDWARNELDARAIVRDEAIVVQESGEAINSQEFSDLMKSQELPGQEKPPAWYEAQWENMDAQRANIEKARNDEFLRSLTKNDLQTTLAQIADNPEAGNIKPLNLWIEKTRAGMSGTDFQAFVAEASKNPAKYRKAITQGLDTEGRQMQQDVLAESFAAKVAKESATDELLNKYADMKIGEFTTTADPRAAQQLSKLLRASIREPGISIDPESRMKIQELQDSVSLESGQKVREVRERLRSYYETHPETAPDAATQAILNRQLVADMTVREFRDLADQIATERFKGKAIQAIKRMAFITETDKSAARLVREMRGKEGFKAAQSQSLEGMPERQNIPYGSRQGEKAVRGGVIQKGEAFTWNLMRMAERMGPEAEKLFVTEVNKNTDIMWRALDAIDEPARAKMKELGITDRTLGKTMVAPSGLEYPRQAVIMMEIAKQNEDMLARVTFGEHVTPADQEALTANLTEEERTFANHMVDALSDTKRFKELQRVVAQVENAPVKRVNRYFPMRVNDFSDAPPGKEIAADLASRSGLGMAGPNKRFTISRIKVKPEHQKPMRMDSVALFFESIAKQEQYKAHAEWSKKMRRIMLNPNVQEQIATSFGRDWLRTLQLHLNNIANPGSLHVADPTRWLGNMMYSNIGIAALGFRLSTMAVQLGDFFLYLPDAGPLNMMESLSQWMKDPKGLWDFVTTRDPQVKHAQIDPLMARLKNDNPAIHSTIKQYISEWGMNPLEQFDMLSRVIGWNAVYLKNTKAGLPVEEAIRLAQKTTLKVKPSSSAKDAAAMYSSERIKFFLMFTRQLSSLWQMQSADLSLDVRRGRLLHAGAIALAIALASLYTGAISRRRLPKDAKEVARDVALGYVTNAPVIGGELSNALAGYWWSGRGVKIVPGITETVQGIRGALNPNKPTVDRINSLLDIFPELARLAGVPSELLRIPLDILRTGDPWELVGGKPKK